MDHEIVTCRDGSRTLRDPTSGCWMHSTVGPVEESRRIYLEPSRLAARLAEPGSPLVLWDVGLGIGGNAIAAIDCAMTCTPRPQRPLHLVSFEDRLDGIHQMLRESILFPSLARHAEAIRSLLSQGEWRGMDGLLQWRLEHGDFRVLAPHAPAPELIWWDFYSPPTCPDLWSVDTFRIARDAAEARARDGHACDLFTYSAATPVRLALILAGFHVGYGPKTSAKNESTIASTHRQRLERPLGQEWLVKLRSSSRPRPWGQGAPSDYEIMAVAQNRVLRDTFT